MVYVDRVRDYGATEVVKDYVGRKRARARWCHMIADSEAELVAFAKRLGLRAEWLQHGGTPKVHFDIVPTKRDLAIRMGALSVDDRAFLEIRRRTQKQNTSAEIANERDDMAAPMAADGH
jgi:hypothetical protein